jgi:hypothetical protein
MLAFTYDAAHRREVLCPLRGRDLGPAHRLLRVRAETTKGHRERVVPYSDISGELLRDYLQHRHGLAGDRQALILSESPCNHATRITLWTWSKVVRSIALRADVPALSTHTLRHLCMTDLTRSSGNCMRLPGSLTAAERKILRRELRLAMASERTAKAVLGNCPVLNVYWLQSTTRSPLSKASCINPSCKADAPSVLCDTKDYFVGMGRDGLENCLGDHATGVLCSTPPDAARRR